MTFRMNQSTLSKRENSWYLKTGHIHHFICKCGQIDQFGNIVSTIHHPGHCCRNCGNSHYLDSVMFLNNKKVTRWSVFNWSIETIKTDEAWVVQTYASIPVFDYALQKIKYRKTVIATNTLFFTGKHEYHEDHPLIMKKYVYNHLEKATVIKDLIDIELEEALCGFVLDDTIDVLAWIEVDKLDKLSIEKRIKLFSFFLKYPHLREYDFFYWDNFLIFSDISKEYASVQKMLDYVFNHRKEKSIKKAYFESYANSMKKYGRYNHVADYIFSRHIEDRNFLIQLINMDIAVKHALFNETHMTVVEGMIAFLKEHYTQRAVTKLFTGIVRYDEVIRDTIWMYRGENTNHIQEHFRKVPLNMGNLHYEFIRIHNMLNTRYSKKVEFEYHQNDLNAQIQKDLIEYRLPETTHILQGWAAQLHNCMSGYSRSIHQGNTLIFGVFKGDDMAYAIEIRGNKIVQALGKYNKPIENEDRSKIDEWFNEVYIQAWMCPSSKNTDIKGVL